MKRWLWCCLFLWAAAAPAFASRSGEVVLEAGVALAEDGTRVPYEVGAIWVPENRAAPGSRLIPVGFARFRARTPVGAPPVFWLPGGPGLAVLSDLDGATPAARQRLRSWLRHAATADLVVVEQRGYSARGERLETTRPAYPPDRPYSAAAAAAMARTVARQAIAEQRGKDLAGYTIEACADDVDAVRRALGYDRIALFAGSFGSQWSLALMRRHPDSVARALLSGIRPLGHVYPMPSALLAALRRIAADADRDPVLAPWMPPDGLMAAAEAVRARLARQPVSMTLDAGAGTTTVVAGVEDFQVDLVYYASDPAHWPAFVLSLYHGHYRDWLRALADDRRARGVKLIAPLIDTSLGATPARLRRLRADPALSLIGGDGFEPYLAAADIWPSPDMGDTLRGFVSSPIPVLMVHGDWDRSTPVEGALEQLAYFPNGRALVVRRGGHAGAFGLVATHPELKEALFRFLRSGSMEGIPERISLAAPAFVAPGFAPPRSSPSQRR